MGAFLFDYFLLLMEELIQNTPARLLLGAKSFIRAYLFSFLWLPVISQVKSLEIWRTVFHFEREEEQNCVFASHYTHCTPGPH